LIIDYSDNEATDELIKDLERLVCLKKHTIADLSINCGEIENNITDDAIPPLLETILPMKELRRLRIDFRGGYNKFSGDPVLRLINELS